nr:CBL-interacting serine/threonine-protein kinase 1-like [Tanacetum cinerariifolium]
MNGHYLTTLSFINSPRSTLAFKESRGYDGATSDMWSCGVTLYVILTGYVPFDDRNLVVLYQRGCTDVQMVPLGANNLINRIHDPNAKTRIMMADIKTEEWFKQDYTFAVYKEKEEDVLIDDEVLSLHETAMNSDKAPQSPTHINAFELIEMSSSLDISGLIKKEQTQCVSLSSPDEEIRKWAISFACKWCAQVLEYFS